MSTETPTKLGGFEFYKTKMGSPKYGVAPMVDASELPFRMLCRKYGADMAWTPMLHSRMFVQQQKYRKKFFTTCPEDRPLAIQFCANDPQILLQAAKLVEHECDAIDINLGCPQNIAKRGNYGAFLCDKWDLIYSMVEILHKNLSIPVFCKIRVLETPERTLEYAKMIERAGCQLLTVHGRTKEQKGHNQGLANWEMIREIKRTLKIPVFANGNIREFDDVTKCLEATECEGVMSACGLLANPALFSGQDISRCVLASEYLEFCKIYPTEFHIIRGHLFKLLKDILALHVDLRSSLNVMRDPELMGELVQELIARENGEAPKRSFEEQLSIKHEIVQEEDFDLVDETTNANKEQKIGS